MTEKVWLVCQESRTMLALVEDAASERKLRLLACACWRAGAAHWAWASDTRDSDSITMAECYADGIAGAHDLRAARHSAEMVNRAARALGPTSEKKAIRMLVAGAACWATDSDIRYASQSEYNRILALPQTVTLLRDIFGNPFLPVIVDPIWRTGTVTKLAHAIYDERAFDRMPILADALEEAGCNDASILDHCRQPAEHVRGCWLVDLLLGKK